MTDGLEVEGRADGMASDSRSFQQNNGRRGAAGGDAGSKLKIGSSRAARIYERFAIMQTNGKLAEREKKTQGAL